MNKILNREILVLDHKVENSKYDNGNGKCLYMQIEVGKEKHVLFTGSKNLMEIIKQIPKEDFPFATTIVKEDERLQFT